jgi:fructose PTS system EIIBC or EIIC component
MPRPWQRAAGAGFISCGRFNTAAAARQAGDLETMDLETIPYVTNMNPLLAVAIVILVGSAGGSIARRLHAPAVTGNILAGVLLGATLFHGQDVVRSLQALSIFGIGLVAVDVGGQLSYRRIHNALRRIVSITALEVAGAVVLVFVAMRVLGQPWPFALLVAVLAAETAPATTLAVVRGSHARGPFVKTLLSVVSLDSSLCIILFAFAHSLVAAHYSASHGGFEIGPALGHTLWQLAGATGIGLSLGLLTSRVVYNPRFHHFTTVFLSILMGAGLSLYLGLSPLLTCLFYGMFLGNSTNRAESQLKTLEPIEPLVYTSFFTLAGIGIHVEDLPKAGILVLAYIGARLTGKIAGALAGGYLSNTSPRILRNLPWIFVPQAGVVIGLIVILEGDPRIPAGLSGAVGTLILAAVTINEVIGPLFTRVALSRAKETGLDRPRLVEFLQEEFIMTNLKAQDKWEAIEKLCDFFSRTHNLRPSRREELLQTVLEREKEMSTAIGQGAALPHGIIESGDAISGVLAICPEGVEFDAPDGELVRLMVLIVTPKEHERRHLEVLSSVASMISDERRRARLITAADPTEVWEIIEDTDARSFNYFLEEADDVEQTAQK